MVISTSFHEKEKDLVDPLIVTVIADFNMRQQD